jgi:hypothetical protein
MITCVAESWAINEETYRKLLVTGMTFWMRCARRIHEALREGVEGGRTIISDRQETANMIRICSSNRRSPITLPGIGRKSGRAPEMGQARGGL